MKRDVPCQQHQAAGSEGSDSSDLGVPFLRDAADRLGLVALSVAVIALAAFLFSLLVHEGLGWEHPPEGVGAGMATQWSMVVASLGMFALTRVTQCPRMALKIGRVYQLLGAVAISLGPYWGTQALQQDMGRMTWLAAWILLFPLLVPARPRVNILSSLAAASAAPAVHGVWTLAVGPAAEVHTWVATFAPYYFMAGLAVLPSVLTYRLSRSVVAAQREAKQLGSYQLVERLGAGGMGEVWRAEHRMLARPAAIKLIQPQALSEGGAGSPTAEERASILARFEREAQATATLTSPHTISLYDYGVSDDGSYYYVMELLDGVDLEVLVDRFGPLPPARVVHLLLQACESLAEAHGRGMVHRDVKPANLFCCQVGGRSDFLKVLDFGLVRPQARAEPRDVKLTGVDAIVGTPAYMAPEQAQGGEVDARSDLYALGCVAFWLLTGQLLFKRDSAMRTLIDHIQTQPDRPSQRLPRPVPPELEDLLMACLTKEPDDRPQTAQELADRLEALDLGRWTRADARAWWDTHRGELTTAPAAGSVDVHASTQLSPRIPADADSAELALTGDAAGPTATVQVPPADASAPAS
jgi:serine/threonine-protein kinase